MRPDEFRDVLDDALGRPPSPSAAARASLRRRVRRRRALQRSIIVVVAVAVTAAAIALAARSGGGHDTVAVGPSATTTTSPATAFRPGWRRVAKPPYAHAVAAVRVSGQVIVAFSLQVGLRFAAFDPSTERWDKLPTPPLDLQAPFSDSPTFADEGGAVIVWGHDQTRPPDTFTGAMRIMEYRPATRSWRILPTPPINTLIQATPIWTGTELIVYGGNPGPATPPPAAPFLYAEAFDPATARWHQLPLGPLRSREDPVVVWTGHEMLVWGGFPYGSDANEGAAFDPRTNAWRVLPPSGLTRREVGATVWTGKLFLVWSGSASGGGDPNNGAAYDPATNQWHPIPAAPIAGREQASVTWTGRDLFVWGGISFNAGRQTLADGATYDPSTNVWHALAAAPLVGRWGAVTIWTGAEVLVVDGYGPSRPGLPSEPAITGAAVYRPATAQIPH